MLHCYCRFFGLFRHEVVISVRLRPHDLTFLRNGLEHARCQPRRAAEKVRSAQLLVCKAELELIRYSEGAHSERLRSIDLSKRMASIEHKRNHWQMITVEAILVQYAT